LYEDRISPGLGEPDPPNRTGEVVVVVVAIALVAVVQTLALEVAAVGVSSELRLGEVKLSLSKE